MHEWVIKGLHDLAFVVHMTCWYGGKTHPTPSEQHTLSTLTAQRGTIMATKTATKTKTTAAKAKTTKPAAATAKRAVKAPVKPAARGAKTTGAKTSKAARAKAVPVKTTPVLPSSVSEKRPWRSDAKVNPKTGFTQGTISDTIAQALLKGGESRKDIVQNIDGLPTQTRKGTDFQPSAVVGQVERQMKAMGFRVVQSYKLLPPAKVKN